MSKHRDVREVSLRTDVFSSAEKSIVPRYPDESAQGQIEAGRASMIMMDDPDTAGCARSSPAVSRPAPSSGCAPTLTSVRSRSRNAPPQEGSGDFVLQVAGELPLQAIAGLLGVPPEDRGKLFDWSNQMIGSDDPEFAHHNSLTSAGELMWYAMQLAARKAEEPG